MSWQDGKVVAASLHSRLGKPCLVDCQGQLIQLQTKAGETLELP
jgi:hypothetical protein